MTGEWMRRGLGGLGLAGLVALSASASVVAEERVPFASLRAQTHFHGLAVDARDPARLLLATHHGFYSVGPDGMAERLSPVQDFMGFTPHPVDPGILYASGHPAGGGNLGVIVSVDGGASWMQIAQGVDGPVDFHQMDISPVDPKAMYGVFGGLQASRDGGLGWSRVGPVPAELIDLSASAVRAERLYAATKAGLMLSEDAGKSWNAAAFAGEIVSLIEPTAQGRMLAFVVGRGLLQAAEADPAAWTPLSDGFGDRILLHLAAAPSDAERLYAATTENELLASGDGGRTWSGYGGP